MSTSPGLGYQSKTDLVVAHLRDAIQAARYRPGDRLVLDTIAAELGVSKIPVREAITRLTGEGLVQMRPNAGPIVPAFGAADVRETALLRAAVESVALEIAIPLHDSSSLAAAQEILDAMVVGDTSFPALNVQFHASLISPIPHRFIYDTALSLLHRAQRYAPTQRVPGYSRDAHEEHVALLAAVRDRDITLAKRLNQAHISGAAERLALQLDAQA